MSNESNMLRECSTRSRATSAAEFKSKMDTLDVFGGSVINICMECI